MEDDVRAQAALDHLFGPPAPLLSAFTAADTVVRSEVVTIIRRPTRTMGFGGRVPLGTVLLVVPAQYSSALARYVGTTNALGVSYPVMCLLPGEVLDFGQLQRDGVAVVAKTASPVTTGTQLGGSLGYQPREQLIVRTWPDAVAVESMAALVLPNAYLSHPTSAIPSQVDVTGARHVTVASMTNTDGSIVAPSLVGELPSALTISWGFSDDNGGVVIKHAADQFTADGRGVLSVTHYAETYEVPAGASYLWVYCADAVPPTWFSLVCSVGA